jgi:hypothetical protein
MMELPSNTAMTRSSVTTYLQGRRQALVVCIPRVPCHHMKMVRRRLILLCGMCVVTCKQAVGSPSHQQSHQPSSESYYSLSENSIQVKGPNICRQKIDQQREMAERVCMAYLPACVLPAHGSAAGWGNA